MSSNTIKLDQSQTDQVFVDGKEYSLDKIPPQYRSMVNDLIAGNNAKEPEIIEKALDQSPQLQTYENYLYVIVQFFSILGGYAFNEFTNKSNITGTHAIIPWYLGIIISLIAGHIGTKLATREIAGQQQKVAQSSSYFPKYFFNRFSKILIAFQASGFAIFITIITYGVIYVGLSLI